MSRTSLYIFFLIAGILFFSYSNTFYVSWQLDDKPNILGNSKLHISELSFQQLHATLRAHPTVPGKIYRPLACLTFGLNWYFGQDNVFGYHVLNLVIHTLTACFLFLALHLLLRIHYKNEKQLPPQFFISAALLGTLFWALAPIQTQAVTYIVQRMASMAAMFSIIGIYVYLRARTATKKKYIWFILCLLSFCAALASKENAVLLPTSLLLLELSFFRHHFSKKHIGVLFLVAAAAFTTGFVFVRQGLDISSFQFSNLFSFLDGYDERSFTLKERLLTEPQVIMMYLSQILLPNVERLSIEHDIVPSTSLLSPWTTAPAIFIILGLIFWALFFLKKYPLVCFPILFFFLNHLVESTIAPLELIFEHRNYLPSLFLFLPIGVLVAQILYSTPPQPVFRRMAVTICTTLFLIISGHATYTRNQAWATAKSLWTDALRKAPNSSRAGFYLGNHYRQFGQHQAALHYFKLSLLNADKAADPKFMKKNALNDLGTVQYLTGHYEQALRYFNQCLKTDNTDEACLKNRMATFLQLDLPQKALSDAFKLTHNYPEPVEYQYLTSSAAYLAEDYKTSLHRMQKIVKRALNSHQSMYLTGILLMKSGSYQNSLFFLQQATRLSPNTIKYQLALAAAHHGCNQTPLARKKIYDLLKKQPLPSIKNALKIAKKYKEFGRHADFIDEAIVLSIRSENNLLLQTNAK